MNTTNRLPTTHGVEIDIQHAEHRSSCIRALTDLYHTHRYRPYQVPLIDSYSGYVHFLDAGNIQRVFRFTNNSGELVLLRPDLTLFIVRHVAHTLQEENLPLRLYYNNSIFCDQPYAKGGEQIEQYQSGVELISHSGNDTTEQETAGAGHTSELELLTLMQNALSTLGLENSVMHIGSRKLIHLALPHILHGDTTYAPAQNASRTLYKSLVTAIRHRRKDDIVHLLQQSGSYSHAEVIALATFFLHIGETAPPAVSLASTQATDAIRAEIERLSQLVVIARQRNIQNIRLDFSEIGGHDYYDGTTFAVYHPKIARKIASGGRYDGLLSAYGFKGRAIAAGFTLFLHRCEEHATITQASNQADETVLRT